MLFPRESSQPPPPPPPAERAVDLLSKLPTELRDKVLGGLPARDVVRTSVLAPAWRYSWKSVAGLDIELHNVRDDAGVWASAARFLEDCAGPVGRVSIRGVPLNVYHRADEWVGAVAGKSPRSLSLALPAPAPPPLPSLFGCNPTTLTELELRSCTIPAPPAGFAGFDRLTKLDLEAVVFTGGSACAQLEAMVSAAAATLVELRLQNIFFFPVDDDGWYVLRHRWVIQAPNLRRLVLCLRISGDGLELGPLPNLELARIFVDDSTVDIDYVKLFTAISNVRELHLGNFHMDTQAGAINIFLNLLRRFQNLRILRLDGNFKQCPTEHLLRLSPGLETVDIKGWY